MQVNGAGEPSTVNAQREPKRKVSGGRWDGLTATGAISSDSHCTQNRRDAGSTIDGGEILPFEERKPIKSSTLALSPAIFFRLQRNFLRAHSKGATQQSRLVMLLLLQL